MREWCFRTNTRVFAEFGHAVAKHKFLPPLLMLLGALIIGGCVPGLFLFYSEENDITVLCKHVVLCHGRLLASPSHFHLSLSPLLLVSFFPLLSLLQMELAADVQEGSRLQDEKEVFNDHFGLPRQQVAMFTSDENNVATATR